MVARISAAATRIKIAARTLSASNPNPEPTDPYRGSGLNQQDKPAGPVQALPMERGAHTARLNKSASKVNWTKGPSAWASGREHEWRRLVISSNVCRAGSVGVPGLEDGMNGKSTLSRPELDNRIAIVRDNIRQLIEQAAATSGGSNEELNADRIARQTEELERLIKERDALSK